MTFLAIEWMPLLTKIGGLLFMLSILIVMHELGHFIPAKLFKTRVEKFYLFFDFLFPFPNIGNWTLFKRTKGETEYGIGWFPFGGYVKIAGMIDESMDKEQMKQPPQPWEFRSKPAWQRLIIMIGGVTVNLILGWFIYSMLLFTWGERSLPMSSLKDGVMADSLAQQFGFKNGDKILAVDGTPINTYEKFLPAFLTAQNVTVNRAGQDITIDLPANHIGQIIDTRKKGLLFMPRIPFIIAEIDKQSKNKNSGLEVSDTVIAFNGHPVRYFDQVKDSLGNYKNATVQLTVHHPKKGVRVIPVQLDSMGKIGVATGFMDNKDYEKTGFYQITHTYYSFFGSFGAGYHKVIHQLNSYLGQLKAIFTPKTGAYKGVGGFITMGSIIPYPWDWEAFWSITAFISLILAVMNLLPIPMLDGGYVLFLLIEMIIQRKIPDRVVEIANYIGFIIVLGLLLYGNGMDIFRLFK
jgi:regulator of sigma E protease